MEICAYSNIMSTLGPQESEIQRNKEVILLK